MRIPKPTDSDKAAFQALVPSDSRVEVKPMFGNLGAFVNGNMFMGLFGADIGVKLDEDDQGRLLRQPGAGPFGPDVRPMAGYVTMPAAWRRSPKQAGPWIEKALAYVASLPPKQPKPKKATKKAVKAP
jgi:TfoX/Sxy family transcriptional regulator of competence genes